MRPHSLVPTAIFCSPWKTDAVEDVDAKRSTDNLPRFRRVEVEQRAQAKAQVAGREGQRNGVIGAHVEREGGVIVVAARMQEEDGRIVIAA